MVRWARKLFALVANNDLDYQFGANETQDTFYCFSKVTGIKCHIHEKNGNVIINWKRDKIFILYSDNSSYIGDGNNYQRHGSGLFYDNVEDSLYFGDWKNDLRHGRGRIIMASKRLEKLDIGGLFKIAILLSSSRDEPNLNSLCSEMKSITFIKCYGVWNEGHLVYNVRQVLSGSGRSKELVKWQDSYSNGVLQSCKIVQVDMTSSESDYEENDDISVVSGQTPHPGKRATTGQAPILWRSLTYEQLATMFAAVDLPRCAEGIRRLKLSGKDLFIDEYLHSVLNGQTLINKWGIQSFGERVNCKRYIRSIDPDTYAIKGDESTHGNTPATSVWSPFGMVEDLGMYIIQPSQLQLTHVLPCSYCHEESQIIVYDESVVTSDTSLKLLKRYRDCAKCTCPRYSFKGCWLGTEVCIRIFPGYITDEQRWTKYLTDVLDTRYPHLVLVIGVVQFTPFLHGIVTEWMSLGSMDVYLQTKGRDAFDNQWESAHHARNHNKLTGRSTNSGFISPKELPAAPEVKLKSAASPNHNLGSLVPLLLKLGLLIPEVMTDKFLKNTSIHSRGWTNAGSSTLNKIMDQLWDKKGLYLIPMVDRPKANQSVINECLKKQNFMNFFTNIALTMMYLHQRGIPHGSLKASNILIGERFTPKLDDFGYKAMLKGCFSTFPLYKNSHGLENYYYNEDIGDKRCVMFDKCCDCKKSFRPFIDANSTVEPAESAANVNSSNAILSSPEFNRRLVTIANNSLCPTNLSDRGRSKNETDLYQEDIFSFGLCLWQFKCGILRPYINENLSLGAQILGMAGGALSCPPLECHSGINAIIRACIHQHPSQRPNFTSLCRSMRNVCDQMKDEALHMVKYFVLGCEAPGSRTGSNAKIGGKEHKSNTSMDQEATAAAAGADMAVQEALNETKDLHGLGDGSILTSPTLNHEMPKNISMPNLNLHTSDEVFTAVDVLRKRKSQFTNRVDPSGLDKWSWGWFRSQLLSVHDNNHMGIGDKSAIYAPAPWSAFDLGPDLIHHDTFST